MMNQSPFKLHSAYVPTGDQPEAIDSLVVNLEAGVPEQILLGVTGSGKTFTMANVIARCGRPALVLAPNKTLAAQLYNEFREFFPQNAVEYFVSYYDYYQPEAYVPASDTYIEKDSSINDNIDKLRHAATHALLTRRDVIIVASVSCIYGLGSPEFYARMIIPVEVGQHMSMDALITRLVEVQYERNDYDFHRGTFRVRGDVLEIIPAYHHERALRIEFFGDDIDSMREVDPLTGDVLAEVGKTVIYPASHFVSAQDNLKRTTADIRQELLERLTAFKASGRLVEAQRLEQRTQLDLEMIEELGYCNGIENYSRHLSGRLPGSAPSTLLDFFPKDSLTLIDESHVAVPQLGGMYEGDRSRKNILVEHGFRLPSALDNRPLKFHEFMERQNQIVYASATPGPFELVNCRADNKTYIPVRRAARSGEKAPEGFKGILFTSPKDIRVAPSPSTEPVEKFDPTRRSTPLIVEQIIRPTGLLEPKITIRPLKGQIDETIAMCNERVAKNERVLVTTLTKKTAEDLTEYLKGVGLKVSYIHADVDAIERVEILRALRARKIDVLVGINLLREGLDLPEVSLVCILDADKEGFLRNETSLVQTAGRAARHLNGECVLFADVMTDSIKRLVELTDYRRGIQEKYNREHGIVPQTVSRSEQGQLKLYAEDDGESFRVAEDEAVYGLEERIARLEAEMKEAASHLEFERAALIRDEIRQMRGEYGKGRG